MDAERDKREMCKICSLNGTLELFPDPNVHREVDKKKLGNTLFPSWRRICPNTNNTYCKKETYGIAVGILVVH